MRQNIFILLSGAVCLVLFLSFLQKESPDSFKEPLGLPPVEWPMDNPYSPEKAELGRLLFFDKRISTDGTVSCASCHNIPKAFADHLRTSKGIHGKVGMRNANSLVNVAYNRHYFWDGRASSLEEQAVGPISNPKEMTILTDHDKAWQDCLDRLNVISGYCVMFEKVFGHETCSLEDLGKVIATFERTIVSGNSAFDRYQAGDVSALTKEQIRGYEIFQEVGCIRCHRGPNFTSGGFANIGIGMDQAEPDSGRFAVTQDPKDWGAFKVPTLRDVARTFPYMHDGSLRTLEEVVDYYDRGGNPNPNLNPLLRPLHLSQEDKKNLVYFLKSLNGEGWQHIKIPVDFPN